MKQAMKVVRYCVNHDERVVQSPSNVLCADCLAELDRKFQALLPREDES